MRRSIATASLGIGFLLCAVLVASCSLGGNQSADPLDFPGGPGGKSDTLGRGLVGVASDYVAAELDADELAGDMRKRREAAWATVIKVLEPVPLLGLAEDADEHDEVELPDGEIPKVARWQTWYGMSDIKRMFQHLYEGLDASERAVKAPFASDSLAEAFEWNAKAIERSSRWPLERYFAYVRSLGICSDDLSDDECAALVQSRFAGAAVGNTRILYSPAVAARVLADYPTMLECLGTLDSLAIDAKPETDDNFTSCFTTEFAANSVLVKTQWQRADFGREVAAHDTDGDALRARLSQTAQWPDAGDRQRQPDPSEIFTIRLRNGDTYRLVGLHVMTKELRHWQWITLWWSDKPESDFGADRPESVSDSLPPVWANYKMCVVGSFEEGDTGAMGRFADVPSLADAIDATTGPSTWCSNPYMEHGRNNAGTNCIGCHQHGGSTTAFDLDGDGAADPFDLTAVLENPALYPDRGRLQIREVFPADYLYSFNRVDDIVHMIESEVSFWDGVDKEHVRGRSEAILGLDADAEAGADHFAARCAACHGVSGHGTAAAPNLEDRVPTRDDASLLRTLIAGRGGMPSWGETLSDQEIADVLAFLRVSFGGGDD